MAEFHTDMKLFNFKTPTIFKLSAPPPKSAPPPITLVDGVPANLTYAFTRKFGPDVKPFFHYEPYHQYGILTRGGKKYYFEVQSWTPDALKIKVCQTDTTYQILFSDTGPRKITQWKEETLDPNQQKELDVFYMKEPNRYFETFTYKQNIWPMNSAEWAQPVSTERNPYFI